MFIRSLWLSSLLFTLSTATHRYPRHDLYPRYLVTGTSNTTSATYPTSSPTLSSSVSNATVVSAPTPSTFRIVIADTGTIYDGLLLAIGAYPDGSPDTDITTFTAPGPGSGLRFAFNSDGSLGCVDPYYEGLIMTADAGATYTLANFYAPADVVADSQTISFCGIGEGAVLTCMTGPNAATFACPLDTKGGDFGNDLLFGPAGLSDLQSGYTEGCFAITLLVVSAD